MRLRFDDRCSGPKNLKGTVPRQKVKFVGLQDLAGDLLERGQYNLAVLNRAMISLQHDRPRLALIGIQRVTGNPWNFSVINYLWCH